jgi:hypothetical protein
MKYSVCHSVKEETSTNECSETYCPVHFSHEAAPVHKEQENERHHDEELAYVIRHSHTPAEPSGYAVFLLVQAEEYCQK